MRSRTQGRRRCCARRTRAHAPPGCRQDECAASDARAASRSDLRLVRGRRTRDRIRLVPHEIKTATGFPANRRQHPNIHSIASTILLPTGISTELEVESSCLGVLTYPESGAFWFVWCRARLLRGSLKRRQALRGNLRDRMHVSPGSDVEMTAGKRSGAGAAQASARPGNGVRALRALRLVRVDGPAE